MLIETPRYHFSDTFDGDLRYWDQMPGGRWRIVEADGRRVLANDPMGEADPCWLSLFERDPRWSVAFQVVDAAAEGRCSFLSRANHPDGAWVRLDYDAEGIWTLRESEDPGRAERVLAELEEPLADGWHRLEIALDGARIAVRLDDRSLLEADSLAHRSFGRIGFVARDLQLHIDAVDYRGSEGRPAPGLHAVEVRSRLREVTHTTSQGRPFWALHLAVIAVPDGHLGVLGYRLPNQLDGGRQFPFRMIRAGHDGAWQVPADAPAIALADGRILTGNHPQVLRLASGEIIAIGSLDDGEEWVCLASADHGATWTLRGRFDIAPEQERAINPPARWRLFTGMQGKLMQTADGTLYNPSSDVLWCSEDRGRTWELRCVFYPDHGEWSLPTEEHAILDRPDGTLFAFARDGRAGAKTLARAVSRDGGRTWSDFTMNATPFVSSKCAFALRRDPCADGTWYLAWTYNDRADEPARPNQPRTRQALAVSRDHGETWQFVCDLDDWGFPPYRRPPEAASDPHVEEWDRARGVSAAERAQAYWQRDNRYCNGGLWIDERFVHFTVRRRFIHGVIEREDYCVYHVRIDKTQIETLNEFPGTRY